jgi:hypothetical protein
MFQLSLAQGVLPARRCAGQGTKQTASYRNQQKRRQKFQIKLISQVNFQYIDKSGNRKL